MWPFSSKKKREGEVNQNCLMVHIRPGYYKAEKELNKALLGAFPFLNKGDLKEVYKVLDRCVDSQPSAFRMMVPGNYKITRHPEDGLLVLAQYGDAVHNCSCSNWIAGTCCNGPNFDTPLSRTVFLGDRGAESLPPSYRTGRHIHHVYDSMPLTEADVEFLKKLSKDARDVDDSEDEVEGW